MTDDLSEAGGWTARSASPEGFIVEEIEGEDGQPDPAGTHVWFTVEKRGIATTTAARRIAQALGKDPGGVGFAGRKDALAVTRQRMSLEHVDPEALLALDLAGIRIRDPYRARTKLRLGALVGNRFHLRLDGAAEERRTHVSRALERVLTDGLPNAYGPQRFGPDGRGWELGLLLARGDALGYLRLLAEDGPRVSLDNGRELVRRIAEGSNGERRRATELVKGLGPELGSVARRLVRRRSATPDELLRAIPKRSRAFHVSMLQARIFNDVLERRVADGTARTVLGGDVPETLTFTDPPRTVPTGPMWSPRMQRAAGAVGALELEALRAHGLEPENLEAPGHLHPRGARRPLIVHPRGGAVEWREDGDAGALWVTFELPVGSYATVVLDQLERLADA